MWTLESYMRMGKWKPAGRHNLIRVIQISSPHSNHIWKKLHLWSIPSSPSLAFCNQHHDRTGSHLNNNLISYRHSVTQFAHLHLVARTLSVRTPKVLHTLEYGTSRSLTSPAFKAGGNVILREQRVSQVHCLWSAVLCLSSVHNALWIIFAFVP